MTKNIFKTFLIFFISLSISSSESELIKAKLILQKREKNIYYHSGRVRLLTSETSFICDKNIDKYIANKICSYLKYDHKFSFFKFLNDDLKTIYCIKINLNRNDIFM